MVNGLLGYLENHKECSATCGMGDLLHVRTRACNNPPAFNGGKECVGNKTETISMPCSTKPCSPKSSCKEFIVIFVITNNYKSNHQPQPTMVLKIPALC